MIETTKQPSARDVRIFALLWPLFFGLVAGVAWFKPQGLVGAAAFLGLAWLTSLAFNPESKRRQLAGAALPALFAAVGGSIALGFPRLPVVLAVSALGVLGALVILLAPGIGRALYTGWMVAAEPVGWTISHLVLAAVYYLVLTPIGLVMRLGGYDPMKKRFDRSETSYWVERKPPADPARYFRQF